MRASSSASLVRDAMCDALADTAGAVRTTGSPSSMESMESMESASSVGELTDALTDASRARKARSPGEPPWRTGWHRPG